MKNILVLFVVTQLFLISCTTIKFVDYEMTNPVRIEQSIGTLDILDFVKGYVSPDSLLAVYTIEMHSMVTDVAIKEEALSASRYYTASLDWGTRFMIEDNLITLLKKGGYRVVERDPDILANLVSESGEEYAFANLKLEGMEAENNAEAPVVVNVYSSEGPDSSKRETENQESRQLRIGTDLAAANVILSYRVLECGIHYQKGEDVNSVKRIARTKLHCRLQDAKTGEILNAGYLNGIVEDEIKQSDLKKYELQDYRYYQPTLPNMSMAKKGSQRVPASSGFRKGMVGMLSVVLLMTVLKIWH